MHIIMHVLYMWGKLPNKSRSICIWGKYMVNYVVFWLNWPFKGCCSILALTTDQAWCITSLNLHILLWFRAGVDFKSAAMKAYVCTVYSWVCLLPLPVSVKDVKLSAAVCLSALSLTPPSPLHPAVSQWFPFESCKSFIYFNFSFILVKILILTCIYLEVLFNHKKISMS